MIVDIENVKLIVNSRAGSFKCLVFLVRNNDVFKQFSLVSMSKQVVLIIYPTILPCIRVSPLDKGDEIWFVVPLNGRVTTRFAVRDRFYGIRGLGVRVVTYG
jgi:hypothetical protein